jgi:isopentenyldiphosphate isomerase
MIVRNGKILFAKRAKWRTSLPNKWSLPAEKIIKEEAVKDAVKRCAWHELALRTKSPKITHERHFDIEDKTLYFVLIKDAVGEAEIQHDEISKIQWLAFEDFFKKYPDLEIGHGLQWLRKHPEIWKDLR